MTDHEDEQTGALLDDYLERLQRGETVDRAELLSRRPDLLSLLDCLDRLERFAPQPGEVGTDEPPHLTWADTPQGAEWSASAANAPPALAGDYEILEEIGRGGMGVVYRARQRSLDRVVAIKMILGCHLASPDQLRRFQLEAKAAAALRHAHIVRVFDAGEAHGQHYFAMEYVEGQSLAQRLTAGLLPVAEAVRLVAQVAEAVEHLHRHGIVHRDVKPSNILLNDRGEPLLTDFGLAKLLVTDSARTASGVIAGTPSYMAPEQAAGKPDEVGPAADVYSLGAILYELLTGRPPFRADTPLDTVLQVLSGEVIPPRQLAAGLDPALEQVCLRCLEKRPNDRYGTAGALAGELQRYLRGEPLSVEAADLRQRVWRWVRREPALAGRLIVLAAFYLVQQFNYRVFQSSDAEFHFRVSVILGLWALVSLAAGRLIKRRQLALGAGFVWGTVDCALLLLVVWMAHSVASPLVMLFPLLIAGAGLWFRVRLVWYETALVVASYVALIFDYHLLRTDLHATVPVSMAQHVIYLATFVLLGGVIAYQVHRVRSLSRYFDREPTESVA